MTVQVIVPKTRDATRSVESVLAQTHKDYVLTVVDTPNIGPGAARNIGARESGSEWLAFLDDDDAWHPNYLSTMLQHSENADLMFTSPEYVMTMPETMMRNLIYRACGICYGSGLMARRSFFNAVGGFDEKNWCSEIWMMCLRALEQKARIISVPGILWDRSYHREQVSVRTNFQSIRAERTAMLSNLMATT